MGSNTAKRRELTLGKSSQFPLTEAREQAVQAQKSIRSGIDPIEGRKYIESVGLQIPGALECIWTPPLYACLCVFWKRAP